MGLFDLDPFVTQPVSLSYGGVCEARCPISLCWLNPNKVSQLLCAHCTQAPFSCLKHCWWRKYLIAATKKIFYCCKYFRPREDSKGLSRDVSCSVFPPRVRVACPDLISDLEPRHRMISILNDMIHWYVLLLICSGPVINILPVWPPPPPCCSVWINSRVQQNNFAAWSSLIPQINELRVFLKTLCVDVSVTTCIVLHIFLASLRYFLLTKKTQKHLRLSTWQTYL